jgi:hypothetical protein
MKLYEYNGAEFSEEDVIAAAKEKGLSTDEYIKKYNIKPIGEGEPGKKKPVAAKGAACNRKNTKYGIQAGSYFFGFQKS